MHIIGDYDAENITDSLGNRGALLYELESLNLAFPPATIVNSEVFQSLNNTGVKKISKQSIDFISQKLERARQDVLFKIILSPSVSVSGGEFNSIHNLGLNLQSVETYAKAIVSREFAFGELKDLLVKIAKLIGISENILSDARYVNLSDEELCKRIISDYPALDLTPEEQAEQVMLSAQNNYYSDPTNKEVPCGFVLQAMVFGHTTGEAGESCAGEFCSRNVVTGEKKIFGQFSPKSFNLEPDNSIEISEAPEEIFSQVKQIAEVLEENFNDIRKVKFIFENKRFWVLDQKRVADASVRANMRIHLDLFSQKKISKEKLINHVRPDQLTNLLHPGIGHNVDPSIPFFHGGIAGSLGSAKGKIYTNTNRFMEAFMENKNEAENLCILCMPSTYAGDVKAIELGRGVISSEGGYASHAPVVARSLGKPAIVIPELEFKEDGVVFPDGTFVKEGETVTFQVTKAEKPTIYFGDIDLVYPDFKENGLLDFMEILSKEIGSFNVRCNADNVREASIGLQFGAGGIGLCRTEHMFFGAERIMHFLWMLYSEENEQRQIPLEKLKAFQKKDFLDIFDLMEGRDVTIRLLDAPLHEFIPHSEEEVDEIFNFLKNKKIVDNKDAMKSTFDKLSEANPMLGHRGIRLAVSHPDIYEMQTEAILEAAMESYEKTSKAPGIEIMIPFIMTDAEFKFIRNGKNIEGTQIDGIDGVFEKFLKKHNLSEFPFKVKVGCMIETPAAALNAGYLSRVADFFSFGTNDLTQMTHALSRDDINSFLPSYTQYDILQDNPFDVLTTPVKELISISQKLGTMVRPDLKIGLCGEQGANPRNISFCMDAGLNYVSCSPYSIPLAILSVVQNTPTKKSD